MFVFILAVAVVFGTIMGAREYVMLSEGTGTAQDARKIGLSVGALVSASSLVIMLILWGMASFLWNFLTA